MGKGNMRSQLTLYNAGNRSSKHHSLTVPPSKRLHWIKRVNPWMNAIAILDGPITWFRDFLVSIRRVQSGLVQTIPLIQHHKRQLQLQRRCTSQRERANSLYRLQDKPAPTDFGLRRTAIRSPSLPFMVSTSVIHVIAWITTQLSTPNGWKVELAWLVDP